jgi:putative ABC transport system ATP-binding protein
LAFIRNKKIGFIFQAYNLLARTTSIRNVILPLLYDRENHLDIEEMEGKALRLLEMVGLSDRAYHQPQELSGGEQQRVAVARALINDPLLIIADEPTGNLDTRSGKEIMNILHQLHDEGATIVVVTHDSKIAAHTERTIHLLDGVIEKIVDKGKGKKAKRGVK